MSGRGTWIAIISGFSKLGGEVSSRRGSGLKPFTLVTKGDGGRDGVFGFPERALAGLGWVNFR
jgi:hypothetical protein